MNKKSTTKNHKAPEKRVAVIHDWLPLVGGAERVLEQILELYPNADIYTLFDSVSRDDAPFLKNRNIITSGLQKLPRIEKYYRNLLPLLPYTIEQFDLRHYELIISSSSAVAKGVISSPDQLHVCYCHSPMRYAWDLQAHYLKHTGLSSGLRSTFIRYVLHKMRIWDVVSSNRVDAFIANSSYIAERINKTYRRESTVINPPVNIARFQIQTKKEDFYLAASRQVPYKRIDLIVVKHGDFPTLIVIQLCSYCIGYATNIGGCPRISGNRYRLFHIAVGGGTQRRHLRIRNQTQLSLTGGRCCTARC